MGTIITPVLLILKLEVHFLYQFTPEYIIYQIQNEVHLNDAQTPTDIKSSRKVPLQLMIL